MSGGDAIRTRCYVLELKKFTVCVNMISLSVSLRRQGLTGIRRRRNGEKLPKDQFVGASSRAAGLGERQRQLLCRMQPCEALWFPAEDGVFPYSRGKVSRAGIALQGLEKGMSDTKRPKMTSGRKVQS